MSTVLGRNNYGKSGVRLVKVTRRADRHDICDLTVDVALEGDFAAAHTAGDNTGLLATDTMRNTVYALAQGHDDVGDLERFGIRLVEQFLAAGPTVTRARVRLAAHPWSRAGPASTGSRPWPATPRASRSRPGSTGSSCSRRRARGGRAFTATGTRRSRRRTTGSWRRR